LNKPEPKVFPASEKVELEKENLERWWPDHSSRKEINTKTKLQGLVDCEGNYLLDSTHEDNIGQQLEKKVRIGTTMMAETGEPIKSESSVVKKTGPVWNLKGRSIEDILTDLEILKNDPDIPMPVIEADPASIEDFQQYTRNIPAADTNEQLDDEQEEKLKDKDSLEYLSSISGNSHLVLKPDAFPASQMGRLL